MPEVVELDDIENHGLKNQKRFNRDGDGICRGEGGNIEDR
jgi:hypothetical protein